MRINNTLTAPL